MIQVSVSRQLREFPLDVSFQLDSGQCLALVGPTGCGKTTTLRIMAGLEVADAGRIEMDGSVLLDTEKRICLPPQQRRLGVVFQDYALFPHMTVLQNVMYGARAAKMPKSRAEETARDALAKVRLQGLEDQRPGQLSGGQQQRTSLARAVASSPIALLMDEPMAALDARTRRQVRSELKEIIRGLGTQTVIVTHDVVDALTLGDMLCVMDHGQIVQTGDRAELLSRPRNQFVAEFLGVNLLPCEAGPSRDGLYQVQCGPVTFYTLDRAEGSALLTCSPWEISLSEERPEGSALNVLHGRVKEISHIGGRTRVTVEDGVSLTAEITHTSEERMGLHPGSMVYASFKASAARVYK